MMANNNEAVLAYGEAFLHSMRRLSAPSEIAVDLFSRTGCMQPLAALADTVASGVVSSAPVTLTVASGAHPEFTLRGTHALATVQADRRGNGAVIVLSLIVATVLIAILLCRR